MNEADGKSIPSVPPKPLRMHVDLKPSTILQSGLNFVATDMKHQIFLRAIEMIDIPKQTPSITLRNPSSCIQAKDTTEVYITRTRFHRYYTITESPHF